LDEYNDVRHPTNEESGKVELGIMLLMQFLVSCTPRHGALFSGPD
jgi:hypothetical protein